MVRQMYVKSFLGKKKKSTVRLIWNDMDSQSREDEIKFLKLEEVHLDLIWYIDDFGGAGSHSQ